MVENSRAEAGFGEPEEEARGEQAGVVLHGALAHGDCTPGEHDAGHPDAGFEAFEKEGGGGFEGGVGVVEYAGNEKGLVMGR